jgi:hypothetical protein
VLPTLLQKYNFQEHFYQKISLKCFQISFQRLISFRRFSIISHICEFRCITWAAKTFYVIIKAALLQIILCFLQNFFTYISHKLPELLLTMTFVDTKI